jgi:tetratricopeptide (TPR) repeat protein
MADDERLAAGRHHLHNGGRALSLGYLDEGRTHFLAALLQFRGPELRLGEAHALRGIAQVELAMGRMPAAEARAGEAARAYSELASLLLADHDPTAIATWLAEVVQGEAAAWALQGEAVARQGRTEEAASILEQARVRLESGPEGPAAATLWATLGRLAARDGRWDEARTALETSERLHQELEDHEGAVVAALALADLERATGHPEAAWDRLASALAQARSLDNEALEARIRCALGNVALHEDRALDALTAYEQALILARGARDPECEALALVGSGLSLARQGDPAALRRLAEGAGQWAALGHIPGAAGALLHLADVGRRADLPHLVLWCAEGARRGFALCDPIHGQGQALRRIVKGLSALRLGRGALVAAVARARVAGGSQPSADKVAAWFIERAGPDLAAEVGAATDGVLLRQVSQAVFRAVEPTVSGAEAAESDLDDPIRVAEVATWMVDRAETAGLRPLRGSLRAATTDVPVDDDRSEDDRTDEERADGVRSAGLVPNLAGVERAGAPSSASRPAADMDRVYGDIYGSGK